MKRVLAVVLCILAMVACLTGCVYEGVDVKLNKEGTGTVSTTVGIEKDFVDNMMNGQNPFEGKETNEVEIDGETYIAYTETVDYETYDELSNALLAMTYDTNSLKNVQGFDEITEEPTETPSEVPVEIGTEATVPASETEDTGESMSDSHIFKSVSVKKEGSKYVFDAVLNKVDGMIQGYDLNSILKVKISVEMPGKVTAFKNGKVDGKKVTFDISDMGEETELYAECKEVSRVPAIVGIALAVIALVVFIFLRRKK